ncbi:MAG: hypothetical protein ACQETE_12185 [Bacteroidota bacterium]
MQEAQSNGWKVKISLVDNQSVSGFVLVIEEQTVTLETQLGELNIKYERIQQITILDPDDPTSEWFANPNESRLVITPPPACWIKVKAIIRIFSFSFPISATPSPII